MSLKKSVTRRLSLLASSSLVAAGLATFAVTGVALAPQVAYAANECGPTDGVPGTTDNISCTPGNYSSTGITYSANGDLNLTVEFASQPQGFGTFITGTQPVPLNVGAHGLDVTATGGDSLSLDFDTGTWGPNANPTQNSGFVPVTGTAGSVINFQSQAGSIDIVTGQVTGSGASSRGVNAQSTTGEIEIETTGTVAVSGASSIGINAQSAGGNIHVTSAAVTATGTGSTGINTLTTGGGDIEVETLGATSGAGAGIRAIAGGGDVSVSTGSTVQSSAGSALIATTTGAGNVQVSAANTLTGAAGAAVDTATGSGNITVNYTTVSGGASATHGVRAVTSGGNIVISGGGASASGASGQAAIEARAGGGNVAITNTAGSVSGRVRGILAETSGAGAINLNIGGNISAVAAAGGAVIDTVTGTGATNINITGGGLNGGSGIAIRSVTAATSPTAAVNIQNTGGNITGRVDFSGVSAGGVTFNNTNTGRWSTQGASTFSDQNDTLTMSGSGLNTAANGTVVDFGAGTDTFNMNSRLAVNGLVTLTNLEAFNNAGVIYMGGTSGTATDGAADDVLRMAGGTYTGDGGRVVMDAFLGAETQVGCETLTGAGDCLDLRGATTAGVTVLSLNNLSGVSDSGVNTDAPSLFNPDGVTLVDVGGGISAAGHFVLDPEMEGYAEDRTLGAVIQRPGLFAFTLRYDAENQRHVLVGLPISETTEYAMLSGAAQSIWYMTTETVTDRQTDLRDGSDGALWMRATGEYTKRDIGTAVQNPGDPITVDNSYKLYAGTIMGGVDLISGHSGGYEYVVGGQIGYVSSSFELDQSPTTGRMTGATGGLYGSIWNSRFFLDGTFNINGLTLDHESPALGSKTTTYTTAFGALLEGGMRHMLTERTFIEPLVTVAFVRTGFEEISLDGGEVLPGDANSRRAALGARLGADLTEGPLNVSYFVAGRAWNEFDGEANGDVHNPGVDLPFHDEFSGAFSEAELGVNVFNEANTLSGFLSSGVKWKDGYSAVNLSLGVRVAW